MDETREDYPLLDGEHPPGYADSGEGINVSEESYERGQDVTGATVSCRVCDSVIQLNGKSSQHVVKCGRCQEATPIRPAPAGKKYVRCPCNCLLICKVASTRIACPRTNCRRVITLGHREPQGSAVRAPTGSCRVSCVYCHEVFLFNTLTNTLANCPHCKKSSTVGGFAHRRAMIYLASTVLFVLISVLITVVTKNIASSTAIWYFVWGSLYLFTVYLGYQFVRYWTTKMSSVLGPI